jgi:hypothetical protein
MKSIFSVRSARLALGLMTLSVAVLALSACAGTPTNDGSQYLAPEQRPSSLPWNAPAAWEGKGQLGNIGTGAQAQGTTVGTGVH